MCEGPTTTVRGVRINPMAKPTAQDLQNRWQQLMAKKRELQPSMAKAMQKATAKLAAAQKRGD